MTGCARLFDCPSVQRLAPQARVGVVHGQMKPAEIEKAMAKFVRQECDVLVCTTIIGSGLDIPTANTIIINRAEKFGLAQLYQIRGRVGRSNQEAFAYLLCPGERCFPRSDEEVAGNQRIFRAGFRIQNRL